MNVASSKLRKPELRLQFRHARQKLADHQRRTMDAAIRERLLAEPVLAQAERIGAYWAFDGEPDLTPAFARWEAGGKRIALPVMAEEAGGLLRYAAWSGDDQLEVNRFGIPEPVAKRIIDLDTLDAVLMPLVAWDRRGGRLGMGAGHFDRLFADAARDRQPLRIGVAYGVQEAPALPMDPLDIRVHAVVTEGEWFTCAT